MPKALGKAILTVLTLATSLSAQVSVIYRPIRIGTTQAIFGPGKSVGFWTVSLSNDGTEDVNLSWEKILSFAPDVPWYTNALGQDLASRQAASSAPARFGSIWDATATAHTAGTVTAIIGMAQRESTTQWVGIGLSVTSSLIELFRKGGPDPSPYFGKMLPESIHLMPGQGGTWYVSSGLVHNVRVITAQIPVHPVISLPRGAPEQLHTVPPSHFVVPSFEVSLGENHDLWDVRRIDFIVQSRDRRYDSDRQELSTVREP